MDTLPFGYFATKDFVNVRNLSTGESWNVNRAEDEERYEECVRLIEAQDMEGLADLFQNKELEDYADQICKVGGHEVRGRLGQVILEHYKAKKPAKYLENFVKRLYKNPSNRVVNQLYDFIEASRKDSGGFTIDQDGYIIGYKRVRKNFTDCHTGTFDNHPGSIVEIPRNQVDENPERTCSYGLHFCAFNYLKNFGRDDADRIVIVQVDPADVVSIPVDYNHAKARCCAYKVIDEYKGNGKEDQCKKASLVYESADTLRNPAEKKASKQSEFANLVKKNLGGKKPINVPDPEITLGKCSTPKEIPGTIAFVVGGSDEIPDLGFLVDSRSGEDLLDICQCIVNMFGNELETNYDTHISAPQKKFKSKSRAIEVIKKQLDILNEYLNKSGRTATIRF